MAEASARNTHEAAGGIPPAFWSVPAAELLARLGATPGGLSSEEARRRLAAGQAPPLRARRRSGDLFLLLSQFRTPIVLILLFAATIALFVGERGDALIILAIVMASGLLGFWQERGAAGAVEKLLAMVEVRACVLRDGTAVDLPLREVVPGDVTILSAGGAIPGDCVVLESRNLFVDEASLTGETYPESKSPGVYAADTPLGARKNVLYLGTHVVSGAGCALVLRAGSETEFGGISARLALRPAETEFEVGIRRFGYLLLEITLVLVITIFAVNVFLARPVLDSFLFSLALAVGLTPQLLPAIISINLAQGAKRMARRKVIVKRLVAIEDFGSMNVLCSDKTGTLTEGVVEVEAALGIDGRPSAKVMRDSALNAAFESGFRNPIDEAVRRASGLDVSRYLKLDEIPYDFIRKRLTVLVEGEGERRMVTKGAVAGILSACAFAETADGRVVPIEETREALLRTFREYSEKGHRTLGVACRDASGWSGVRKEDEAGMTFLGFLVLSDPPKPGIADTIRELADLGVAMKILTGDNHLVAESVSRQVGFENPRVLRGPEIREMSEEALLRRVADTEVFAEVEPNQKERILRAIRKSGNVVGYLGDGINDASALHAAQVGISVESAVDVAKEAADIVLLEKDLEVLVEGVREGRRTFANTLKYVFMATSANFGNMFSMAGASLFLPFLPLLPKQILLTNLLTDFPEMTIAADGVDPELITRPRRWDLRFVRSFMMTFGLISSLFDYVTFAVLLLVLRATPGQFRTGWLVESVISASMIVLVIRTRRPFYRSRPARSLLVATLLVGVATLSLPWTPLAGPFDLAPLPVSFLAVLGGILALYVIAAEAGKAIFYRRTLG